MSPQISNFAVHQEKRNLKAAADLAARIFIAILFYFEAYDSLKYFKETKEAMSYYRLEWNQDFLLKLSIFLLILGASMILIGYRARLGSVLLLLYWVPVTFIVYSFWNDPESVRRVNSLIFMRNMAISGGLLVLMVNGSGDYSVKRLLKVMRFPRRKW